MYRIWKHFIIFLLLIASVSFVGAQDIITIRTESGFLVDMPEDWDIEAAEDTDNVILFEEGSMFGGLFLFDANTINGSLTEYIEELLEDFDDDGMFEPIEIYSINAEWDAARASRIRRSNRMFQLLITAENRTVLVLLIANFRVGSQQDYLPMFDNLIATARIENETDNETAGTAIELVGTVTDPINVGALTANFVTSDERFQFDYPTSWEIRDNEDGSLHFINRGDITLLGTLKIARDSEANPEMLLSEALADKDDFSEIEIFSLNGLPTARAYHENTRGASTDVVMATMRGDIAIILQATSDTENLEAVEPILRAVLFSIRYAGETFELTVVGGAARQGLMSGQIYGAVQRGTALPQRYITDDGRYSFSYPEEWSLDVFEDTTLISNAIRFESLEPEAGEVQIYFFFLDRISGLDIDDFSSRGLLQFIIDNDIDGTEWGDIMELMNMGRRAAYADIELLEHPRVNLRSYFLELNSDERIYVRVDMVTLVDEITDFEAITLAIMDTIGFAN